MGKEEAADEIYNQTQAWMGLEEYLSQITDTNYSAIEI